MTNKQNWLLEQITKFPNLSARELTAKLNDKVLFDNTELPQQVLQVPTIEEIVNCCTAKEALSIYRIPNLISDAKEACATKNVGVLYILLSIISNQLSAESYSKIENLLQRTVQDTNYEPKLLKSPAEEAGFSVVLVNEIEELMSLS